MKALLSMRDKSNRSHCTGNYIYDTRICIFKLYLIEKCLNFALKSSKKEGQISLFIYLYR